MRFLELFYACACGTAPTLCRTFCSGGAQWSSPSTLWDIPCARRVVAALNGALPALCGAVPVLGGLWRRSTELSHHSVGHSGREGPRPSSGSNPDLRGQTPCTPPPQSPPCCDNPAISTNTDCGHASSTIALTEKMETVNTFNTVKPKILREFKLLQ